MKTIKWATKLPIKKEKERAKEKDRNRFAKKSKFWLLRMRDKQKKVFNYVRLVGKYVFSRKKLVFSYYCAKLAEH